MYTAYFEAIKNILNSKVTAIPSVGIVRNQYENYGTITSANFPKCYVEFVNPIQWETKGEGILKASGAIKLHLVLHHESDIPNASWDIAFDVNKAFHGKPLLKNTEPITSELMRSETELISKHPKIHVLTQTYATTLFDVSAEHKYVEHAATFFITRKHYSEDIRTN